MVPPFVFGMGVVGLAIGDLVSITRHKINLIRLRRINQNLWIPAFTGMTVGGRDFVTRS